jgi:hypothetical protein
MKLDRNTNPDGRGKYALIKLRETHNDPHPYRTTGGRISVRESSVDHGDTPETEFFVIRLKDKYAAAALYAYGNQARHDDPEWAEEIFALADKAKALHETGQSKMPD